jgi:hypothetical protein
VATVAAANGAATAADGLHDPFDGGLFHFDGRFYELHARTHCGARRLTDGAAMFAAVAIFLAAMTDDLARTGHAEVFADAIVFELRFLLHLADRLADFLHLVATARRTATAGASLGGESDDKQHGDGSEAKHDGVSLPTAERNESWYGFHRNERGAVCGVSGAIVEPCGVDKRCGACAA